MAIMIKTQTYSNFLKLCEWILKDWWYYFVNRPGTIFLHQFPIPEVYIGLGDHSRGVFWWFCDGQHDFGTQILIINYAHRHWEGSADHRSEYNRTLPTQTASGTIREALAALRRPAQPSGDTQMARRITGASVVELYRCIRLLIPSGKL